jgi:hypothetical protein
MPPLLFFVLSRLFAEDNDGAEKTGTLSIDVWASMASLFAVVLSVAAELVVTTQLTIQSTSTKAAAAAAAAAAEGESTLFFSCGRVVIWGNDGCHGGCDIIVFCLSFVNFPPRK